MIAFKSCAARLLAVFAFLLPQPLYAAPEGYEGAPQSDDNLDCPYPLKTKDEAHPWDDFFRWGYTLRASYDFPGSGGMGLGLRWFAARPISFALGVDALGGVDEHGRRVSHLPLAMDARLFVVRGGFAHAYLLGGVAYGFQRVELDERLESYRYWGPRLGVGTELKGARDIGWGLEVLSFSRLRSTADADLEPRPWGWMFRLSGTLYPHD